MWPQATAIIIGDLVVENPLENLPDFAPKKLTTKSGEKEGDLGRRKERKKENKSMER